MVRRFSPVAVGMQAASPQPTAPLRASMRTSMLSAWVMRVRAKVIGLINGSATGIASIRFIASVTGFISLFRSMLWRLLCGITQRSGGGDAAAAARVRSAAEIAAGLAQRNEHQRERAIVTFARGAQLPAARLERAAQAPVHAALHFQPRSFGVKARRIDRFDRPQPMLGNTQQ